MLVAIADRRHLLTHGLKQSLLHAEVCRGHIQEMNMRILKALLLVPNFIS